MLSQEVLQLDALGAARSWTYTYDANRNQTSSKKVALNETTTTTYNAFSEPLTTTNPVGNTTTITYDSTGLPTTFTDSMGPLATFTSTVHGLPSTVTDAAGNIVFLGYDASGDLTQRTDRLGRVTGYAYTGSGRKDSTTDARGGVTSYYYDYDLRQKATTNAEDIGQAVNFDLAGNVQDAATIRVYLGVTIESDRHASFTYDAANRQIEIFHGDDASEIHRIRSMNTVADDFAVGCYLVWGCWSSKPRMRA